MNSQQASKSASTTNRLFTKVLIANRGEIAVRVIKTCRDLGIATVALYTDADRTWLPRQLADEAVHVGEGPATESYIHFDKVIEAAKRTGADAIHPGYGFLAENADFARRCEQEGIVFIGPSADNIELMGNKARAKTLVASLGIPVIPGTDTSAFGDGALIAAANDIGYPVMLKAVAGGGGMGIRIVNNEASLMDALSSVRHEARASFGDDRLLIEKYFPSVRHIEIQVLADAYNNAVHCYERECSVQRRRQKVIEEAPSPFISEQLRTQLCEASLQIVEAVGYQGVGTVEFVVVDSENDNSAPAFYFLEMNTRLQVEHGVTEAITGLDLVRLQIQVAEGKPLPIGQKDIPLMGHAIECRLCAEQPAKRFQPVTGIVHRWQPPEAGQIRVDTGVRAGTEISIYYDSLIAKLIATGESREQALRAMRFNLRQTAILGLETNQVFLSRILDDNRFTKGLANTTYIEEYEAELLAPLSEPVRHELWVVGAVAFARDETQYLAPGQGGPFQRSYDLVFDGKEVVLHLTYLGASRYQVEVEGKYYVVQAGACGDRLRLSIDGVEKSYAVASVGQTCYIHVPGEGSFSIDRIPVLTGESLEDCDLGYTAAMAGQVVSVLVKPGDAIEEGDKLLVIESMKMEHGVAARSAGTVKAVMVTEGGAVQAGMTLLTLA